ncbi:helix-turn-helix domain-containing protein [Cohnella algarum]|uniref:helix-turn-helix domain-containing protein n=1 Tax=Cohnella algarum TaxID=2044859 RepID=UPI001968059F|nr:helix-turn-helix domain-containing protein [Cohnella algarum]MBN2980380.1 helix-turn-helix domain-containing protein [Cohnella algarum]
MEADPPVVIEEANRLHFPVLELPYEFTFADQMNALVEAEIEKSTRKLHDALDKQKSLMRFAMQPGDSANHFQRIGDILSYPIVIVGARGQILYNTCDWPEAEVLKDWPWNPKFDKSRSLSGWRCTIPLIQDGECCGFLLVMPRHATIIQEEEGLFHQAAEILSFHMDRFQDERQSVSGYRWSLVLERYLQKRITPEQFLEQTRALRQNVRDCAYLCVKTAIYPESPGEDAPHKGLRKIRRELMYHPYLSPIGSHHLFVGSEMVTLFALPAESRELSVPDFVQRIVSALEEVVGSAPSPGYRCYVSKPKLKLADILEASDECDHAKSISERLSFGRAVTLFSDLELNYVFRHIPRDILAGYSDNLLLPLLAKDEEYRAEMLKTLEAYMANEGNVNETAKELFVHRNTVLYRLEKASELLRIDLKKMSDQLQLKLAMLFRQLAEAEDGAS